MRIFTKKKIPSAQQLAWADSHYRLFPFNILNKVCAHVIIRLCTPTVTAAGASALNNYCMLLAGVQDQVIAEANNYCMRSFTWFSVSLNVLNKECSQLSISHALIHAHIHEKKSPLHKNWHALIHIIDCSPQYSEQSLHTRNNSPLHSNNYCCRCLSTQ